jgi:AcrR family transcriptional regulator
MSALADLPEKTDGRRARAIASRARILEAMVDLIQEGEIQPSAEAVALRAGVGVRTVFRLFNDVDGLRQGLQEVMVERLAPIYSEPVHGTLLERLDQLVARRRVVFEKLARPKAFADAHRVQSPSLTAAHQNFVRRQRELLLGHLDGVLSPVPDLIEALDLTLSFDVWRRLREDQRLAADDAERVMRAMVRAVVAGMQA